MKIKYWSKLKRVTMEMKVREPLRTLLINDLDFRNNIELLNG